MTQQIKLKHGDILHAGFTAPIQELLSGATPNFRITVLNTTTLKISAGEGDDQQSISIDGRYRYRSTETTAVLPGGLANGEHPVFVTASDNDFGGPIEEPDITTHTFALQIKKTGETPSTAIWRLVGYVTVTSSAITGFRQVVGSVSGAQIEKEALGASSTIEWTRDASGAMVPSIKAGSLEASALAALVQQALFQPGDLKPTAMKTAPTGWLLCDGAEKSRAEFAALWNVIKESGVGGTGNGSTTFNVPDLRARMMIHPDGTAGRIGSTPDALGNSGGAERVTLGLSEIPSHSHSDGSLETDITVQEKFQTYFDQSGVGSFASGFHMIPNWGNESNGIHGNTGSAGSGGSHNNMPPYLVVNVLIKT